MSTLSTLFLLLYDPSWERKKDWNSKANGRGSFVGELVRIHHSSASGPRSLGLLPAVHWLLLTGVEMTPLASLTVCEAALLLEGS